MRRTSSPKLAEPRYRTPVRQLQIMHDLKQQIVQGHFHTGAQMPTRAELGDHYQASAITIQRVLDTLRDEGFVEPRGPKGTFITQFPPHRHHYGLVFPSARSDQHRFWSKFWSVLETVAHELSQNAHCKISVFYGAEGDVRKPDYQRLRNAAFGHCLAGLIYSANPFILMSDADLRDLPIPQIVVADKSDDGRVTVGPNEREFLDRALTHLAKQGRRRVAIFSMPLPEIFRDSNRIIRRAVSEHGLTTREAWIQPASFPGVYAYHQALLLASLPARERPDAILISDDNLEEPVLRGLITAGMRIGRDADVVVHANFPSDSLQLAPVRRLGIDCQTLLQTAMNRIDDLSQGQRVPLFTALPTHFEDELPRRVKRFRRRQKTLV